MTTETLDQKTIDNIKAKLPEVNPKMSVEKAVKIWTIRAELAGSLDEVYAVGQSMEEYGRPIKFDTKQEKFGLWTGAFSTISFAYAMYSGNDIYGFLTALAEAYTGVERVWFGWGAPALFALLTLFWWRRYSNKEYEVSYLSGTLAKKAALYQNHMKASDVKVVGGQINKFGELRRGNHDRYIRNPFSGSYRGRHWSFIYEAYRLHYIDEHRHETTDMNGQSETEITYKEYDRSGIMLSFPWVKGIHLCRGFETTLYPAPYKPASMQFNQRLHCRGADDTALARFLTPKMVERLIRATEEIPGLCIEVNQNGQMLIACNHDHVVALPHDTKGDKECDPRITPEGFNAFLHQTFTMPRLAPLLKLADDLAAPYTR